MSLVSCAASSTPWSEERSTHPALWTVASVADSKVPWSPWRLLARWKLTLRRPFEGPRSQLAIHAAQNCTRTGLREISSVSK